MVTYTWESLLFPVLTVVQYNSQVPTIFEAKSFGVDVCAYVCLKNDMTGAKMQW